MVWRIAIYLVGSFGLAFWLAPRQEAGEFGEIDRLTVDVLAANARDVLGGSDPAGEVPVTVLLLRREDSRAYGGWPPPALAYAGLFRTLGELPGGPPRVTAVAPVLDWPGGLGEIEATLLERGRIGLPQLVLACELGHDLGLDGIADPAVPRLLPPLPEVVGEAGGAPSFSAVVRLPEAELRPGSYLGFLGLPGEVGVGDGGGGGELLVAGHGGRLYPSLLMQVGLLWERAPLSSVELRFGRGAILGIGLEKRIPLRADGSVELAAGLLENIRVIDGAALASLAGGLDPGDAGQGLLAGLSGGIVLIELEGEGGVEEGLAGWEARALALATLATRPEIGELTMNLQRVVWGVVLLWGCWVVAVRRGFVMVLGLLGIVVGAGLSFANFRWGLVWCPPTVPVALLGWAVAAGLLIPRPRASRSGGGRVRKESKGEVLAGADEGVGERGREGGEGDAG
jgi:hypothetical protein